MTSAPPMAAWLRRVWREEIRALIERGIDPNAYAAQQARTKRAAQLNTFEAAANEWLEHKSVNWSPAQIKKVSGIVRRALLPSIGKRPIAEITPAEILHVLKRYEKAGKLETAHSAREYTSAIFRRSIVHGLAESDPTQPLRGALQPKGHRNLAHLTELAEIGALMRAIDGMDGSPVVVAATKLSPLLFVRPGELRKARWNEIDLENRVWNIPAERMKTGVAHRVPLTDEMLRILAPMRAMASTYVFEGQKRHRPLSNMSMLMLLRRMGRGNFTVHGFRSTFRDWAAEAAGAPREVAEAALAHQFGTDVERAYARSDLLERRRELMGQWSCFVAKLET